MTSPFIQAGDFVWSAFPQREAPRSPGPRHIAYVLASAEVPLHEAAAFLCYTTTQPWPGEALPPGVFVFSTEAAAQLGQSRPFVIDARRLAWVPISLRWFPDMMTHPRRGIVGAAPPALHRQITAAAQRVIRAGPPLAERLGPLWPKQ